MSTLTTGPTTLRMAAELEPREITSLAEIYRSWRSVLAAALDAVHAQGERMDPALADELRQALAPHAGQVPETDLEDAVMALWLNASSERLRGDSSVTALLREPVRTFNATRTADRLRAA